MKIIIKCILFTCSLSVYAANWYPVGKLGADTVYMDEASCEKTEAQNCEDVTNCPFDECKMTDGKWQKDPTMATAKETQRIADENAAQTESDRKSRIVNACPLQTGLLKDLCDEIASQFAK